MSTPIAYFDADRNLVVLRHENGTEFATLSPAEAVSFGQEVLAAGEGRSTGYEEFLAQERGEDTEPASAPSPTAGQDEDEDEDVFWHVRWEMDLEGGDLIESTPEAAAREAMDALTREGSIAHVFQVSRNGGPLVEVDLDEIDLGHRP